MGAGVGAVYTVTGAPPPCGTSAMLSTLTPMTAQSSLEASLTMTAIVALGGGGLEATEVDPVPPPQAARLNEAKTHALEASNFDRMTDTSCKRDR